VIEPMDIAVERRGEDLHGEIENRSEKRRAKSRSSLSRSEPAMRDAAGNRSGVQGNKSKARTRQKKAALQKKMFVLLVRGEPVRLDPCDGGK